MLLLSPQDSPFHATCCVQIPVMCGDKEGMLYFPSRTVLCACSECVAKPVDDRLLRCTAFETHGGRGSAKKWMDSVLVTAADAQQLCGSKLPSPDWSFVLADSACMYSGWQAG